MDPGFAGFYSLADTVPIMVLCRNGSYVPTAPDAAPSFTVYDSSGSVVSAVTGSLGAADHNSKTGLRRGSFVASAGNGFALGKYTILVQYAISSTNYSVELFFAIV